MNNNLYFWIYFCCYVGCYLLYRSLCNILFLWKGMIKMRTSVDRKLDKYVFAKSADRTKAINLSQRIFRGGIRF